MPGFFFTHTGFFRIIVCSCIFSILTAGNADQDQALLRGLSSSSSPSKSHQPGRKIFTPRPSPREGSLDAASNTRKSQVPHPSYPARPPQFSYTPAEQALRQFFNTSIAPRRGRISPNDLQELAAEFAKTVVQNDQPRPFHKNAAAFSMEGCPHHSPQSALQLMQKLQGAWPSVYLSTPCISTDSFGEWGEGAV
jgi:hypothetical protein